ncbi:MAG: tetratricopeptide repeat protein [Pseudomonadota bacterium]
MNTIKKILKDLEKEPQTYPTTASENSKKDKVKIFSLRYKKIVKLIVYLILFAVIVVSFIKVYDMKRNTTAIPKQENSISTTTPTTKLVEKTDPHQHEDKKVLATATHHPNIHTETEEAKIKISKPLLTASQQLINQYNAAIAAINRDDTHQAIKLLKQIITHDPDNKNAHLSLAAIYIQQDKINAAIQILQARMAKNANDSDYAKLYAYTLIEKKASQQALNILIQAQPNDIADNTDYFALMASLYLQQQDYYHAKTIYQALIHLNPQNSLWWAGLGIANDKLGLTEQASNAFTQANQIGRLPPALQSYINNAL